MEGTVGRELSDSVSVMGGVDWQDANIPTQSDAVMIIRENRFIIGYRAFQFGSYTYCSTYTEKKQPFLCISVDMSTHL